VTLRLELIETWAITPSAFRALQTLSESPDLLQALQARDAAPVAYSDYVGVRGDVAIIHVRGTLARYHSAWFATGASYGELRKATQSTLDNGARALLVVADSNGGEINGLLELCQALYEARSRFKATAVYVSGACASAAYCIASAVGKVYCSATSTVGGLGVVTTLIDDTKAQEDAGVREWQLVSAQSPKKLQLPSDAGYRGRVQQRLDDTFAVMAAAVAKYRGVKVQTVLDNYGQGDVLVGQKAVDAGLADGVSDVESVIADLQKRVDQSRTSMSLPWKPAASSITGATSMKTEKLERHRAKLGLNVSASAEDVKTAWKAHKSAKRVIKAQALGLPASATAEQIKEGKKAQQAIKLGLAPTATKAEIAERETLLSSNDAGVVARRIAELRAKGGGS